MCALLLLAAFAARADEVEVVVHGAPSSIDPAARSRIAEAWPRVMATCSLNSRDHAHILAPPSSSDWQELAARDHLRLALASPLALQLPGSRVIAVDEFLVGLGDARFPGPQLSRHGGEVTAYAKCSGLEVIRFVCAPEIKPAMPTAYHALCRFVP